MSFIPYANVVGVKYMQWCAPE